LWLGADREQGKDRVQEIGFEMVAEVWENNAGELHQDTRHIHRPSGVEFTPICKTIPPCCDKHKNAQLNFTK
jgi:hypothetical protein